MAGQMLGKRNAAWEAPCAAGHWDAHEQHLPDGEGAGARGWCYSGFEQFSGEVLLREATEVPDVEGAPCEPRKFALGVMATITQRCRHPGINLVVRRVSSA